MVCKKCGNELIEGIDICPFCGETSEIKKDNNLNIKEIVNDLDSLRIDINNNETQDDNDNLALTQDLENLKMEIENLEIDDKSSEEDKQEVISADEEEIPSINDIINNIKPILNDETKKEDSDLSNVDVNYHKIDMSNYIEIDESNDDNLSDEIKEEVIEDTEINSNEYDTDIPNINSLINDLKEIPIEKTNEENNTLFTDDESLKLNEEPLAYDLINDLKSIKIEGINPILNKDIPQDTNDSNINNNIAIKNDYLLKSDDNFTFNNENDSDIFQKDSEPIKIDLSQINENNLRFKNDKLRIDDKEDKVYINENLEFNSSMVQIPTKKEEAESTNNELIQSYSTSLKSQESVTDLEKTKPNTNYMVAILFVIMIILGIAAALVFSHIFNL